MNNKTILINLIWKFAERFCTQIVSFIVSIVLARILVPRDYSIVAIAIVFISFADVFVSSSLPQALIQKNNVEDDDYSTAFYANLILSIVLYIILFYISKTIASFYQMKELTLVIRLLSIKLIVDAFNSVQHAYVSKNMIFKKYFFSTLIGTLISGIIGIYMAIHGYNVYALVAQNLINMIIDTIVLYITVPFRPKRFFSLDRCIEMMNFGWKVLFENLSATLHAQLRGLLIGKYYNESELAYYSKGQSFPKLILNNISNSISQVLFPAMSNVNDDKTKVKQILRKSVSLASYIMFPIFVILIIIAKPLVILLLTEKWVNCIKFLQGFCILSIIQVGMSPRHEALKSIGRSDVYMNEHIIFRIVDVVVLIIVLKTSSFLILLSYIVTSIFLLGLLSYTSFKYNNYLLKEQIEDIFKTIVICIVMGLCLHLIGYINMNMYRIMVVQVIFGVLIYILLSIVIESREYNDIKQIMIRHFL